MIEYFEGSVSHTLDRIAQLTYHQVEQPRMQQFVSHTDAQSTKVFGRKTAGLLQMITMCSQCSVMNVMCTNRTCASECLVEQ